MKPENWYYMERWPAFVWFSLNFIINLKTHISIYFKILCWNWSFDAFITKSLVYKKWPMFNKWRKLLKFSLNCYKFRKKYVSHKMHICIYLKILRWNWYFMTPCWRFNIKAIPKIVVKSNFAAYILVNILPHWKR